MWRRLILVAAAVAVVLVVLSFARPSTRQRILKVTGPVDRDAPREFTVTDTGLRYRILRQGQGRHPRPIDTITVNHAGWLDDGTRFDSTYGSQPLVTPLTRVVRGWTEGLQLVGAGGMIELEVPSELGYGSQGSGPNIPPDATLHFIVELIKVDPADEHPYAGPRDPDAAADFTTTDSGLKYKILRKGSGEHPSISDIVTVHYKGWLDDGTVFDSSYDRNAPVTLSLDAFILGWREALPLVGAGGMMQLEVPSELGYGAEGAGGKVPPDARLHFLVELLEVR